MKKISKTIYYLFFGAIGAVALFLASSILPIPGGVKFFVVQSGSMEPSIRTGGVVVVRPVAEYRVGDVVTFRSNGGKNVPTTHRIVEIKDGRYVTKGDANDNQDTGEVTGNKILGRVLFDVPYLGYAVRAAKTPYGFIAIIVIPAAIIIFDELKKIYYEVKKIRKKGGEAESAPAEADRQEA